MYYVIESAKVNGSVAKAITTKESYRETSMLFHQTLASMMANDNVEQGFCTVLDHDGKQIYELTGSYYRQVEE